MFENRLTLESSQSIVLPVVIQNDVSQLILSLAQELERSTENETALQELENRATTECAQLRDLLASDASDETVVAELKKSLAWETVEKLYDPERELLSQTEAQALKDLSDWLENDGNTIYTALVGIASVPGTLITVQSDRLNRILKVDTSGLEPVEHQKRIACRDSAITHLIQVAEMVQNLDTHNPLAVLIACVHDWYKYILREDKVVNELALHEPLSTLFGTEALLKTFELIFTSLQIEEKQKNVLLSALKKITEVSIFTHGEYEFPEQIGKNNPFDVSKETAEDLTAVPVPQKVFGSPYIPVPRSSEIPLTDTEVSPELAEWVRRIPMLVSVADKFTGAMPESFIKYHHEIQEENRWKAAHFADYVKNFILQSFTSCFEGAALSKLHLEKHEIVQRLHLQATLTLALAVDATEEKHAKHLQPSIGEFLTGNSKDARTLFLRKEGLKEYEAALGSDVGHGLFQSFITATTVFSTIKYFLITNDLHSLQELKAIFDESIQRAFTNISTLDPDLVYQERARPLLRRLNKISEYFFGRRLHGAEKVANQAKASA